MNLPKGIKKWGKFNNLFQFLNIYRFLIILYYSFSNKTNLTNVIFMKLLFNLPVLILLILSIQIDASESSRQIILTGHNLSIEDIVDVANAKATIAIAPEAWENVQRSHEVILNAARENKMVYGLTTGVGLNKDKKIFEGDSLSQEALAATIDFNRNNLYATSTGVGPEMPARLVTAVLLVKLNSMLQGTTGIQPKIAELLYQLIQKKIQPILPGRGSIGEADITILSHIGLVLMGQGEVYYDGQRMPASHAFEINGLKPIIPYAKDSLSIMSSNAYSAALAAFLIYDAEQLVNKADLVFALSLEGLNGNIAPFLSQVQDMRPYQGQKDSAKLIRKALEGSFLWDSSSKRELQDPLSFRNASQIHGTVRDLIRSAKQKLSLHLNASDDNPVTILEHSQKAFSEQEGQYYLKQHGAVIPTANFDTITWIIDFEALGIGLSHLSHSSTQRMIRLGTDKFTHLARFLSPDPKSLIFSAIQKTFVSLDTEIHSLSMPVSADTVPVAGEIEDHATNAPLVLKRMCQIIDNLYYILGMELMHAAQAVDLRRQADPLLKTGKMTGELFQDFRKIVPFIEKDRPLAKDIENSHDFMAAYWTKRQATLDCLFKDKKE